MPIQIIMFENRIEIRNPGGIYGRIRIDQLGKVQTRHEKSNNCIRTRGVENYRK